MTYAISRAQYRIVVVCLALCTILAVSLAFQRDRATDQRDAARSQVTSLQLQIIRGCVAHPDGSGECRAGVLLPVPQIVGAP